MTTSSNTDEPRTDSPGPACACGAWWRLPALLAIVLVAILLFKGRGIQENARVAPGLPADTPANASATDTVALIVQLNDGNTPQLSKIKWSSGMTIGDLMNADPQTSFKTRGSGASAFVTEINQVANEGAGRRNWMYSVNGKAGDRSFAIYELQSGDHVLWSFKAPQ